VIRRRLFNFVSVLSFLLSVGTALLWARSYYAYDLIVRESYIGIGTELFSVSGRIIFYHFNYDPTYHPPLHFGRSSFSADSRPGRDIAAEFDFSKLPHWWNHIGFLVVSRPLFGPGTSFVVVAVPHAFAAVILLLPSTPYLVRLHQRRVARKRRSAGACTQCGYMLTANASGVCPECGTQIAKT
jgi:hypothetical protein